MKYRILSAILSSCLLLSGIGLPVTAQEPAGSVQSANTVLHEGTIGTVRWTIDSDGVLRFGEGSFSSEDRTGQWPWTGYMESVTRVDGTQPVTVSGSLGGLFQYQGSGSTPLRSVDLSGWDTSGVTDMVYMFSGCRNLETVNINSLDTSSVTDFTDMFGWCSSLEMLDLSSWDTSSAVSMSFMFYCSTNLRTLYIDNWSTASLSNGSSAVSPAGFMFSQCSSLETVRISNTAKNLAAVLDQQNGWYVNNDGPYSTSQLSSKITGRSMLLTRTQADPGEGLEPDPYYDSLGLYRTDDGLVYQLFSNGEANVQGGQNDGITEVFIPAQITYNGTVYQVKQVGHFADYNAHPEIGKFYSQFDGLPNLKKVTIEDGIEKITQSAFEGCRSLEEVSIPDSVINYGTAAFSNCSSLRTIQLSNSAGITRWMFSGASSLEEIVIPGSVKSITRGAFDGCTSLSKVTIPRSVTEIEGNDTQPLAFMDSPNLVIYGYSGTEAQRYANKYSIPFVDLETQSEENYELSVSVNNNEPPIVKRGDTIWLNVLLKKDGELEYDFNTVHRHSSDIGVSVDHPECLEVEECYFHLYGIPVFIAIFEGKQPGRAIVTFRDTVTGEHTSKEITILSDNNQFDISKDFFSFKNFGSTQKKYWSAFYNQKDEAWISDAAATGSAGQCYGFSIVAALLNNGNLGILDFRKKNGALNHSISEMNKDDQHTVFQNINLSDLIKYSFTLQVNIHNPEFCDWTTQYEQEKYEADEAADERARAEVFSSFLKELEKLKTGENEFVEVGIEGTTLFGKKCWHSILAYDYDYVGNTVHVYIADSNNPAKEKYLILSKNDRGQFTHWEYPDSELLFYTFDDDSFTFTPLDSDRLSDIRSWFDTQKILEESSISRPMSIDSMSGSQDFSYELPTMVSLEKGSVSPNSCSIVPFADFLNEESYQPSPSLYISKSNTVNVAGDDGAKVSINGKDGYLSFEGTGTTNVLLNTDNKTASFSGLTGTSCTISYTSEIDGVLIKREVTGTTVNQTASVNFNTSTVEGIQIESAKSYQYVAADDNSDFSLVSDNDEYRTSPASKNDIAAVSISGLNMQYAFTGKSVTPKPVLKTGSKTLVEGIDYTLSYSNNVNPGTATLTITGIGSYSGKVTKTFTIVKANTQKPGDSSQPSKPDDSSKPVKPADQSEGVTMHRLYNPNSGEHFYTASDRERDYLASIGWNSEGDGWIAPDSSNTPVYRLYNENAGDHHYTLSEKEKNFLVSVGWKYEGIGWYSDETQGVPLYRQYNPNAKAGSHNYTTSKKENDYLASIGWKEEGIGWYGMK